MSGCAVSVAAGAAEMELAVYTAMWLEVCDLSARILAFDLRESAA
jgi:hypothetical protein